MLKDASYDNPSSNAYSSQEEHFLIFAKFPPFCTLWRPLVTQSLCFKKS